MSKWMIIAAEHRLPRGTAFAAHRVLAVADGYGRCVRQFNGLASSLDPDSGDWRCKPIGFLPSDRLRVYDTAEHPYTALSIHGAVKGVSGLLDVVRRGEAAMIADRLDATDLALYLSAAREAMKRINAGSPGPSGGGGLPYPFLGLGPNSNSVFSTLLAAMGMSLPQIARGAWLVPGLGRRLLDDLHIRDISDSDRPRAESGFEKPSVSGADMFPRI